MSGEDAWIEDVVEAAGGASVAAAVTPASRGTAAAVAARLQVPAALVLTCGLTGRDGTAWGALDEEGSYVVDYFAVAGMRLDEAELQAARRLALPRIEDGRARCPDARLGRFLPAKRVVLVQHGLEQGLLMDAAVSLALRHGAEEVVVTAPWATARAAARFRDRERVVLACPRVLPPSVRPGGTGIAGW